MPFSLSTVIGEDGRVKLTDEERRIPGFRQTGIIKIGDEGFGTGIVTGANCDVVITAAHLTRYNYETAARYNGALGDLRESWRLNFVPDPMKSNKGYQAELVGSGFDNINNIPTYQSNRAEHQHDWSILRISRSAMVNCVPIKFMRDKANCDGPVRIPAVHTDAHFDTYINDINDDPCYIRNARRNDLIRHDCDTKEGASGAPLFCETAGELYLIGINSGFAVPNANYKEPMRGQSGAPYNHTNHVNFAVPLYGEFLKIFEAELKRSEQRRQMRKH